VGLKDYRHLISIFRIDFLNLNIVRLLGFTSVKSGHDFEG